MTVRFVWLRAFTHVTRSDCAVKKVGYNIVIENNGPARAEQVEIKIWSLNREPAGRNHESLLDVAADEFPIQLDPGVQYPIPFELVKNYAEPPRRFAVVLGWRDKTGDHEREVILRRGQTSS